MITNCIKANNNIAELLLKLCANVAANNVLSKQKRKNLLNFPAFYLFISIENLLIKFYKTNQ